MRIITRFILVLLILKATFAQNISSSFIPLPRLDGKIIGGDDAKIEDYPYQLSLQFRGRHICGASLIGPKWAVTAAHCTDRARSPLLTIRAGSSSKEYEGQVVAVKKIYQHPRYSSIRVDFDISLLELKENITIETARPVPLAHESSNIVENSEAIVTGWGSTKEGGSPSSNLQVVKVPIISKETCKKLYGKTSITERMICAGYVGLGLKDACQGDSGGPLVINGYLTGIVSWGYGCARPEYPGVYSSVPSLRKYIRLISGI